PSVPENLQEGAIDLGGMTAQVIHCPGHTPGSAVIYVPERQLLLSADDWNPCTWLFFPAALGAQEHRANVRRLMQLPHTHVLCSHQPMLFERSMMDDFLNGLTDDVLRAAKPVDITPYEAIDTHQAELPHGQIFVFDWAKAGL
ncbi:MAG: MBL fold metallo-hydrolase, partial [Clostridia bacterium]|nr:MBL fold metallo-hydrolase [Clostridia bacterium]